jgi:hypothetical protein
MNTEPAPQVAIALGLAAIVGLGGCWVLKPASDLPADELVDVAIADLQVLDAGGLVDVAAMDHQVLDAGELSDIGSADRAEASSTDVVNAMDVQTADVGIDASVSTSPYAGRWVGAEMGIESIVDTQPGGSSTSGGGVADDLNLTIRVTGTVATVNMTSSTRSCVLLADLVDGGVYRAGQACSAIADAGPVARLPIATLSAGSFALADGGLTESMYWTFSGPDEFGGTWSGYENDHGFLEGP